MAQTAERGASSGAEAGRVLLRVLATTDVHGYLRSHDYGQDQPGTDCGLTRIASLVQAARAEVANTLLFDNGDILQGTPLVDHWARRGLHPGEVHPVFEMMNALGYDAGTIGNHEFNFGLDYLCRAIEGAGFPLVCANAVRRAGATPLEDETLLPPWAILERALSDAEGQVHRLKIGVIGFVPPQILMWDRLQLEGRLSVRGINEAARAHVPALRAAGADVVIALAHTGIEPHLPPGLPDRATEHAAVPLAAVPGIDALICGHSHLSFPGPDTAATEIVDPRRGLLHGKPAVMPGRWGSHLGVIDLALAPDGAGGWGVVESRAALRPVLEAATGRPVPEAPALVARLAPAHEEVVRELSQPVTRLAGPIQSFFSMIAPDAGLSLIAAAQTANVRARLAGRPEAALPVLAAVAPGKCGGRGGPGFFTDIPAGPLSRRHVLEMSLFPNTATAVLVRGAQLADWLERAACVFATITPGQADQPLLDPAFPCYNFDVLAGLSYEIDLSRPARFAPDGSLAADSRRIRDLRHAGQPVDPTAAFVIATNSYRSAGAGGFPGAAEGAIDLGPPKSSRVVLFELLERHSPLQPVAEPVWRFAPIPGASALLETSPRAAGRLAEAGPTAARLEELGLNAAGFLQIRVHF